MADDREQMIADIKTTMDEVVWRSFNLGAHVLRQYELTLMQALALAAAIRLGPDVDMTTLANATMLSPSTMTSAVDRLVDRGLLNRAAHIRDRRKVVVSATDAGLALNQEMEARDLEFWRWMMRDASTEHLQTLRETFHHLLASIESANPDDFQRGMPFPASIGDDVS